MHQQEFIPIANSKVLGMCYRQLLTCQPREICPENTYTRPRCLCSCIEPCQLVQGGLRGVLLTSISRLSFIQFGKCIFIPTVLQ